MGEESRLEIPFMLKLTEVSQILKVTMGELRALIRSKEIEILRDPYGPRIQTQSIIEFLGRNEFKKRWPQKMGEVKFEEEKGKEKRR